MTQTVDLADIQAKLIDKLKPSGWSAKLKAFVHSSDFEKILEKLLSERDAGRRFTPPLKIAFRAFEECPTSLLKVVFLNSDPYPSLGCADGLAFSSAPQEGNNVSARQLALENILDAIEATVYGGFRPQQNTDLTRWANQGVLLLNMSLTTQVDVKYVHAEIWNHFTAYVLDTINNNYKGLVFVLFGRGAWSMEDFIGSSHFIIKVSAPEDFLVPLDTWDCGNLFNKINQILQGANQPVITW